MGNTISAHGLVLTLEDSSTLLLRRTNSGVEFIFDFTSLMKEKRKQLIFDKLYIFFFSLYVVLLFFHVLIRPSIYNEAKCQ